MTGPELRELRQARGLTQEQAAKLTGYTLRHFARLEKGDTQISARWANALERKIRNSGLTNTNG